MLIAVLQGNDLILCVFRRQTIDFVRTKGISGTEAGPDEPRQISSSSVLPYIAEQINKVIQFYDVEVPDSCGKWEITVVADSVQLPESAEEILRTKVTDTNLNLITGEDISDATVVSQSRRFGNRYRTDKPSLVAVGLAMKLLGKDIPNLGVNLLPPERARLKAAQKGALITANIVAAVLLIMILAVNGPTWKTKKLNERINRKKAQLSQDTRTLVGERALLDEQIDTITQKLGRIDGILGSRRDVYWPALLSDIARRTPKTICITGISGGAGSSMSLEGLAISNEDVYLFVDKLSESGHIESASILETEKDNNKGGLVNYEIQCSLAARREI